jgi:2-phosphosulfolactate phosphatase
VVGRDPHAQHGATVRVDWGLGGLHRLAPGASVVVIVDVLRFTTAVSVAVERGCAVYPAPWRERTNAWTAERGITVAGRREDGGLSLSPTDLARTELPDRLVLPSPNGSALTVAAQQIGVRDVLAGCLRNAAATAQRAAALAEGGVIAVIAAGEVSHDGPLRPAIEDLLGAGAVISAFPANLRRSPEATVAQTSFAVHRESLGVVIGDCASARELAEVGFADDVAMASELDVCHVAAELREGAYVAAEL